DCRSHCRERHGLPSPASMPRATVNAKEQTQARRGIGPGEALPVARTSWQDDGLPAAPRVAAGDAGFDQGRAAALADMAKLAAGQARVGRKLANDGDAALGRPLGCDIIEALAGVAMVERLVEQGVELRRHRIGPIAAGGTQGRVELAEPPAPRQSEQEGRQRGGESEACRADGPAPYRKAA